MCQDRSLCCSLANMYPVIVSFRSSAIDLSSVSHSVKSGLVLPSAEYVRHTSLESYRNFFPDRSMLVLQGGVSKILYPPSVPYPRSEVVLKKFHLLGDNVRWC